MNRLADLLVQMNRERLPDDYIELQVEAFVNDLKMDFEAIEPKPPQLEVQMPLFCHCDSPGQRQSCPHNGTCIVYGEI